MNYYEICFHENTVNEWCFYIKEVVELSRTGIKNTLKSKFLGVHGLSQNDIDNISYMRKIDKADFQISTGLE